MAMGPSGAASRIPTHGASLHGRVSQPPQGLSSVVGGAGHLPRPWSNPGPHMRSAETHDSHAHRTRPTKIPLGKICSFPTALLLDVSRRAVCIYICLEYPTHDTDSNAKNYVLSIAISCTLFV